MGEYLQGKIVNGYQLKYLLGEGGMAEVWYAENEIGVPVAVKILHERLMRDEKIVDRFHNEAVMMVKLRHPNIRQVYGYGYIGNRHCIVMEYLEGDDLETLLQQGRRFTDTELCRWWNQIVDALNYTHAQGIVHRDIKPSNFFLDKNGNIKLLDFGIAKMVENASLTQTGTMMGTLLYMSPEQVKSAKYVDSHTDLYSLAVTFVHLLTGRKPYENLNNILDIQLSILNTPLDLSGVPSKWREFLSPYLNKDASRRPALNYFYSTEPSQPQRILTKKPKDRTKLWAVLGTAAVVVIVALTISILYVTSKAREQKARELNQKVIVLNKELDSIEFTITQTENLLSHELLVSDSILYELERYVKSGEKLSHRDSDKKKKLVAMMYFYRSSIEDSLKRREELIIIREDLEVKLKELTGTRRERTPDESFEKALKEYEEAIWEYEEVILEEKKRQAEEAKRREVEKKAQENIKQQDSLQEVINKLEDEKRKAEEEEKRMKEEDKRKAEEEKRMKEEDKKAQEKPQVNEKALFKKDEKPQEGSSEGVTGKPGDQGKPKGMAIKLKEKSGVNNYDGQGGKGNGSGIIYDAGSRKAKFLQQPSNDFPEEGQITVIIHVNREGKVVKAEISGKGTVITNKEMRQMALESARMSEFVPDPNAPEEQTGTITYNFVFNQ